MKRKPSVFNRLSELGRGNFGEVFLAEDTEDKDRRKYAIKLLGREAIIKDPMLLKYFRTEVAIMRKIKHPNILHCYEKLEDNKYYYLVLDYCEGGDLEKLVKNRGKLNLTTSLRFLKQMISGFAELHQHSVIHRDFKPANVFLHNDNVVIGDFGFAKSGAELALTQLGTPMYTAPEILCSDSTKDYDNRTDLWSLGVTFYFMLSGRIPWSVVSIGDLINKINNKSGNHLPMPNDENFTEPIKYLLRRMIEVDPNKRISWKELTEYPLMFIVEDDINSPTDHILHRAKTYYASKNSLPEVEAKMGPTQIKGSLFESDEDDFGSSDSWSQKNGNLGYPSSQQISKDLTPKLKTNSSKLLESKMDEQAAIARSMLDTERDLRYLLGVVPRSSMSLWIAMAQITILFQKITLLKIEETECYALQESAEHEIKQNTCEKILEELHQMTAELSVQLDNLRLELIDAKAMMGDNDISAINLSVGSSHSQGTIRDNLMRSLDNDICMVYLIMAESGDSGGIIFAIKRALAKLEGERRRERSVDGDQILPEGSCAPIDTLLHIVDKQIEMMKSF